MTSDTTAADVEKAISRGNQLFDASPWLSRTTTHVPGCANLTYADLYSLLVAAGRLQRVVLNLGGGDEDDPVELAKRRMAELLTYEENRK